MSLRDITEVQVNGQGLGLGGYLDIGIIDTMKNLLVNFAGAVVFSVVGFFYAKSKGKVRNVAMDFVPHKKSPDRDYLQHTMESGKP